MIGVIDVGGGLRGIFGAGVFDYCLDKGICFDYCIGVSAGSANVVSYAAGQRGRNYHYFIDYSFRKEYMSFGNLLKNRSYLNMDYIYGTLYNADGERPLDYAAMASSGIPIHIVTTLAKNGVTVYFTQDDIHQDCYDVIKASCSIPIVNQPYIIDGEAYYDGGLSNPIPIEKAFSEGCDKVVVILTKPVNYQNTSPSHSFMSHLLDKKYPKIAQQIREKDKLYHQQLQQVIAYAEKGRALIVVPRTIFNMKTLTKDKEVLQKLYDEGLFAAQQITAFVK